MTTVIVLFLALSAFGNVYDCRVSRNSRIKKAFSEGKEISCGKVKLDPKEVAKPTSAYFHKCDGIVLSLYSSFRFQKGIMAVLQQLKKGKSKRWKTRPSIGESTMDLSGEPKKFLISYGKIKKRRFRRDLIVNYSAYCEKISD